MNLKSIKIFIILCLGIMIIFSSCGKKKAAEQNNESTVQQSVNIDVDQLLADAEELVDQSVSIEGVCTHICKHGGRKIFLMGSDDTKTIRIEGGEVGKFDARCVNNMVEVTGKVREQRIDETYLQQWEARIEEETAEKHGEGEEGCSTEKKARNETGNSTTERIANFRERIAEREAKDGKAYLSFYYMEAEKYSILN
ncbi:hypothetical protein LJB95_01235 [Paludibacteraceae bacterium OttesenSCG-928-F17]|nr:hypothetical protein [Paludibacteraceae bacterium OttesenSCG-928-F17]